MMLTSATDRFHVALMMTAEAVIAQEEKREKKEKTADFNGMVAMAAPGK